jgi:hypothetical protein
MWWCCGKAHASDAGCQQGPHEPLADPTDEDPEDAATCAARLKCICCKERGHLSEDCPQEPNIRTTWNLQGEHLRVSRIQSLRKLFAETNVATTQFLKTCVKVPKVDVVDELASDYGEKKAKEQDQYYRQYNNFFQRGAMLFEDYNYQRFNEHILVNKDRDSSPGEEFAMLTKECVRGGLRRNLDQYEHAMLEVKTERELESE